MSPFDLYYRRRLLSIKLPLIIITDAYCPGLILYYAYNPDDYKTYRYRFYNFNQLLYCTRLTVGSKVVKTDIN